MARYRGLLAGNERGMAFITTLLVLLVLTVLSGVAVTTTITDTSLAGKYKVEQQAQYVAEAGIQHAMGVLAGMTFQSALNGPDNDRTLTADNGCVLGVPPVSFGGGRYTVRVVDNVPGSWTDTDGKVFIRSTGTRGTVSRTVEVFVQKKLPSSLRGAVTTNGPASTNGNLQIDGRDHDTSGTTVILGQGTLGVSTRSTFAQGGSNDVGGTNSSHVDYAPSRPANPSVIEQNATWSPPTTPDDVLDLPAGTLKAIAQNAGTYYNGTTPTGNLSGVTYIEGNWNNATINGTGILVLHNTTSTAFLDKFAGGAFTGLIITDRLDKIHGTLIGAISVLSTVHTGIGNGSGKVLFSSAAIYNALGLSAAKPKVLTWRDCR